ncbi:hypothetical protein N7468_005569 [Penicillium chermesinum]|uniref:BTB domain-containing protein n=1 Tax=Penicillium chermesinum TaxID=63820 RepID=A0A9W9TNI6_9EURO|nr:uncharacterized protein N7468_005569 [Penicillium chermesinum]KAJ5232613.1 hypothetical protein N7468_005569 [Penicillium chermesinum]KAJ6172271.1 hypothetical protein N7470_001338 [Penicillium chermesinum]
MGRGIRDNSIIHSPSFTFLVGPKHTKLTIQSALAEHVSKPLHNLMNNGHTRESKHRIAILEDEDVETFVAFCEYAYTGDYAVPHQQGLREDDKLRIEIPQSPLSCRHSWRQSQRSESFSSALPTAPSPPPESVDSTVLTIKPQIEAEPEPPIVEDSTAEEAAEAEKPVDTMADSPPGGDQEVPAEAQGAATTPIELVPEPERQKEQDAEPARPEPEASATNLTEAVDFDSPVRSLSTRGRKKAKRAALKKQQELQSLFVEEPPANPTPPSTPPPEPAMESSAEDAPEDVNVDEMTLENQKDEAIPVEEYPTDDAPADSGVDQEPDASEPEPVAQEWGNEAVSPSDPVTSVGEQSEHSIENDHDQEQASEPPKPIIDMSFAKQPTSSSHAPGLSLWDEFESLRYNDDRQALTHTTTEPPTTEVPYLTFHAKVYVFATRYLIPALAQLCLRKLHQDLLHISFGEEDPIDQDSDANFYDSLAARQAPMVLDLLRYAYFKTTRLEPISPTSATQLRENELRKLVVHFAACKIKELARYHPPGQSGTATPAVRPVDAIMQRAELAKPPTSLRALLDMTPELASDLVYRMM